MPSDMTTGEETRAAGCTAANGVDGAKAAAETAERANMSMNLSAGKHKMKEVRSPETTTSHSAPS